MAKEEYKPQSVLVIGSRGSGKSTLIKEWVQQHKKNFKDRMYLISPTALLDSTLSDLVPKNHVFTEYSDAIVDEILKTVEEFHTRQEYDFYYKEVRMEDGDTATVERKHTKEELKKGPPKAHFLLLLDDILGMVKAKSKINFLFTRHRHYKLSLVFISQNYKGVPPIVRNNTSIYLLSGSLNRSELQKIADEHSRQDTPKEFVENFVALADKQKPYQFLELDYTKHPVKLCTF